MNRAFPLSALLSQALVAYTVEFDNEAERQIRHRTTRHHSAIASHHAPWLVSMVMWTNCMQFVGEEGIPVRELERRARTKTNLAGMQRWGYVVVAPDPMDRGQKPSRAAWVIRTTPAGRRAREVWQPLFGVIEQRWRERFGADETARLRKSLWNVVSKLEVELPDCLPILGYGLFSREQEYQPQPASKLPDIDLPLSALLSKVLLAFAIEFEEESILSLAMSANVVRVVEDEVRVQDLPRLTGISKEAVATSLSFLTKRGYVLLGAPGSGAKRKAVRLTAKGTAAKADFHRRTGGIENRWRNHFGESILGDLREALESLVGDGTSSGSPLFRGLDPTPDLWRAAVPRPEILPHYPTVLHRGGFPDGS